MKRQETVLLDTIQHYGANVSRRCESKGLFGTCHYDPNSVSPAKAKISDGCAVGRLCSPKKRKELDALSVSSVSQTAVFTALPKKIQSLGQEFLQDLQNLHDGIDNWGKRQGLSGYGRARVKEMVTRYGLNESLFKKYLPKQ